MRKPPVNLIHGHCCGGKSSPTYRIWAGLHGRCNNPNDTAYSRYGAVGIKICPEWDHQQGGKFVTFLADMGERPEGCSIDRIDGTKGYSKSNCRWATIAEQARNKKNSRLITHNGETKCLQDWAQSAGLKFAIVDYRLKAGWTIEEALKPSTLPRKELTLKGRTQSIGNWSRELRIQAQTIRWRLKAGWPVEKILQA